MTGIELNPAPCHIPTWRFQPTHYMRLIQRVSHIIHGIVEYQLTEKGIENPNCTICPVMLDLSDSVNNCFIEFDNKVY